MVMNPEGHKPAEDLLSLSLEPEATKEVVSAGQIKKLIAWAKGFFSSKEAVLDEIVESLDKVAAIATEVGGEAPLGEEKIVEAAKAEIEALKQEAHQITEATLTKVGEQLGSNRGGWYEDKETKERHYIKFYKNPDQARAEFIANAVYEKLDIRAVRSQLLEMEGQLAIASKEVVGAQGTYREDQKTNPDVRNGFVADAYLANWDVVGLNFDNIVKGEEGQMYRIDNGGSLVFRVQGGIKDYSPDQMPELEKMLKPEYPAGQVFESITDEEMRTQAEHLVDHLKPSDIMAIIKESGVAGELAEKMSVGLLGRRQFLIERFGLKEAQAPTERIPVAMEKLLEMMERLKEVGLRPRVGFLADADKIENQQVDVIHAADEGKYEVSFKLTAPHYERIKAKLEALAQAAGAVKRGTIFYGQPMNDFRHYLSGAWEIEKDGITVQVSTGQTASASYHAEVRAALGLVRITIPATEGMSHEEIGRKINDIFVDLLEIQEGLVPPETSAENEYKQARYLWHHKLDALPENWSETGERLTREEVFPGYFTMVEKGKHKEYEALSTYAVYHHTTNMNALPKIIQAGGLLATHERYRRGLLMAGMSSDQDLISGGADSVFTRTVAEAGLAGGQKDSAVNHGEIYFVFDGDIFDRTDWYAYSGDNYGRTAPDTFKERQSPRQLFEEQKNNGFAANNEQMFRLGIPLEKIRAIVCKRNPNEQVDTRLGVLRKLNEAGIKEINGKSIDEFVLYANKVSDFIDVTKGERPRSFIETERLMKKMRETKGADLLEYFLDKGMATSKIVESLAGLDSEKAWEMRERISQVGYRDGIVSSLTGLDSERAWEMRERFSKEGYGRLVVQSLAGLDSEKAWEMRERFMQNGYTTDVVQSLAGLDSERAWEMRERISQVGYTGDAVQSLTGLDSYQAWEMRDKFFSQSGGRATIAQSLIGLDSERAWEMRERILQEGCTGDVAQSLAGLNSERAWKMRERLLVDGSDVHLMPSSIFGNHHTIVMIKKLGLLNE